MTVDAVFFDVGGTLYDESRAWSAWADILDVDALTLFAVLGATIERGEHHTRALEIAGADVDLDAARRRLAVEVGPGDLYPARWQVPGRDRGKTVSSLSVMVATARCAR